jgi:elongation factor P
MIKASELKKGDVVDRDGDPHIVEGIQVQRPSARGGATLYKTTLRNARTRQAVQDSFRGDDALTERDLDRRAVQYSYADGDTITFMDLEDYSEFALPRADLAEELKYMTEGMEDIVALSSEGSVIGIQLPATVTLQITDTAPAMPGASATARTKPATLETGLVVQVPEYIAPDTVVKVDTRSGEFLSRA